MYVWHAYRCITYRSTTAINYNYCHSFHNVSKVLHTYDTGFAKHVKFTDTTIFSILKILKICVLCISDRHKTCMDCSVTIPAVLPRF